MLVSDRSIDSATGAGAEAVPVRVGMMITSIAPTAGGVTEAARSLTRELQGQSGLSVEVFSMSPPDPCAKQSWGGAELHHYSVRGPRSLSYAPALRHSLRRRSVDLLHLHGLWQYPSVATRSWTARTGRPSIISPHGMLDAWALANSRWKKRVAGFLFENENLRQAACLHALCGAELQAIRECGLRNPVCVIPNGVDAAPSTRPPPPAWRLDLGSGARVLLYLGRLHPKKNLVELLHGWHAARFGNPTARDWKLVIAGPGSPEYVRTLTAEIAELGIAGSVRLIGPQYGPDKHACFAWADAFVLPSLSEGLPMAVLEAWSWSLPALLTSECNLPEGYAAGAALRLDPEHGSIAAGLDQLFMLPDERRRQMGERGLELTSAKFAWDRIAEEFRAVYSWLLGTADPPSCIANA